MLYVVGFHGDDRRSKNDWLVHTAGGFVSDYYRSIFRLHPSTYANVPAKLYALYNAEHTPAQREMFAQSASEAGLGRLLDYEAAYFVNEAVLRLFADAGIALPVVDEIVDDALPSLLGLSWEGEYRSLEPPKPRPAPAPLDPEIVTQGACRVDRGRLAPFAPCTEMFEQEDHAPGSEWPWNVISPKALAYSCGAIVRAGDRFVHNHDPEELELCRRLSAEAAAIMTGVDFWMGSEGANEFVPYFLVASAGWRNWRIVGPPAFLMTLVHGLKERPLRRRRNPRIDPSLCVFVPGGRTSSH